MLNCVENVEGIVKPVFVPALNHRDAPGNSYIVYVFVELLLQN